MRLVEIVKTIDIFCLRRLYNEGGQSIIPQVIRCNQTPGASIAIHERMDPDEVGMQPKRTLDNFRDNIWQSIPLYQIVQLIE